MHQTTASTQTLASSLRILNRNKKKKKGVADFAV